MGYAGREVWGRVQMWRRRPSLFEAVEGHHLFEVVVRRVLVARQRVRVGKVGLQLDGALEELERGVVLLRTRSRTAAER